MASTIFEKIDFLMKITGTQNAALGKALSYDASYISRIRNGKRGLPLQQPFIEPAAEFFAEAIKEEYQIRAITEEMHLNTPWPQNRKEAAKLLEAWMSRKRPSENPLERILSAIQTRPQSMQQGFNDAYIPGPGENTETRYYYGKQGKRDSVIAFLSDLAGSGKPYELLLYSDENMDWMLENPAFLKTWAMLMIKITMNGGHIKMIHSISRNAGEMYEAVTKWMPLYMSGAVEPYYYPKLRDGIFRRTIFIAEGHSAIVSNSVTGQQEEELNALITDIRAVKTITAEFNTYLSMCSKLMEIVRTDDPDELISIIDAFRESEGKLLACHRGGIAVCVKVGLMALVIKTEQPRAAFLIREQRLVAALEEYLMDNCGAAADGEKDLQEVIDQLA